MKFFMLPLVGWVRHLACLIVMPTIMTGCAGMPSKNLPAYDSKYDITEAVLGDYRVDREAAHPGDGYLNIRKATSTETGDLVVTMFAREKDGLLDSGTEYQMFIFMIGRKIFASAKIPEKTADSDNQLNRDRVSDGPYYVTLPIEFRDHPSKKKAILLRFYDYKNWPPLASSTSKLLEQSPNELRALLAGSDLKFDNKERVILVPAGDEYKEFRVTLPKETPTPLLRPQP